MVMVRVLLWACATKGSVFVVEALSAPASRAAPASYRAVASPVVIVGPSSAGPFEASLASLAEAAAAELGSMVREVTSAACVAGASARDVLYVRDGALEVDEALRAAVAREPATVWARCVEEAGGDADCEASRPADLRAAATRYDVAVTAADPAWAGGGGEVARLAAFGARRRPTARETALDVGCDTFFVSLTFPEYSGAPTLAAVRRMAADAKVQALEVRVDLLAARDTAGAILRALAAVRDGSGAGTAWCQGEALPVMYTVRSADQAGTYPAGGEAQLNMARLLELGARAGVDWLDVEFMSLSGDEVRGLEALARARGATRLLMSHHAIGRRTTLDEARAFVAAATDVQRGGVSGADCIKLVTEALGSEDVATVAALGGPGVVALALGPLGQVSRVLNRRFTPATHDALGKSVAAPGQLTPDRTMELRRDLGLIPPGDFFIVMEADFGSKSPAMHNAAFQACGLPHVYGVLELPRDLDHPESQTAATLRDRLRRPTFGGASVTIPHKQTVIPFLDELTDAARRIGAVNTIIPVDTGTKPKLLRGDNTDWIGLSIALGRALESRGRRSGKALVVGAGGASPLGTARAACYAVTAGAAASPEYLGGAFDLFVHARDTAKASDLAEAFGGTVIPDLATSDHDDFDIIISTIPGEANFVVPPSFLASRPAVLDAAYKPAETALLAQAGEEGCPRAQGASMLLEQGVCQFELWNQRRAPTVAMRAAVFDGVPDLEAAPPTDHHS